MSSFNEISIDEEVDINGGSAISSGIQVVEAVGGIALMCQCYPIAIVCACIATGYHITSAFYD